MQVSTCRNLKFKYDLVNSRMSALSQPVIHTVKCLLTLHSLA
jgi:hypothetical protein